MSENQTLDNYKLKIFLYKFTPLFSKKAGEIAPINPGYAHVDKFSIELDESKYFSKYDISDFVSSYTFSQDLNENTYSWSIVLQNAFMTFSEFNTKLLVEGQRLGPNNLKNLAQYEASSNDIDNVTTIIEQAKKARGTTTDSMSIKAGGVLPIKIGIKLQDLIQPYDVVSVFLYKGKVPVTDLYGIREKSASHDGRIIFTVDPAGLYKLTAGDLRLESVLLSRVPNSENITTTLFSNEFNGFIMVKNVVSEVGTVETVNISGNGISRLFGATRRVIKQGILQESLYTVGVINKPDAFTPYQTIYANKTMVDIFLGFFKSIYGIQFALNRDLQTDGTTVTKIFERVEPESSFYDISSLMIGNKLETNLFNIPPFLLALVMKRHGFTYRAPENQVAFDSLLLKVQDAKMTPTILVSQFHYDPATNQLVTEQVEKVGSIDVTNQSLVDTIILKNPNLQIRRGYRYPIFFSGELNILRGYFLFFAEILKDFSPDLKTPFEIIDEVKEKTFLEFFERPNGEFYIRTPQYNDTSNTIYSSTLSVINTSYTESVANLVTLQKVDWVVDIINRIMGDTFYSFMDGKLFSQYGFIEATSDSNPNATNDKTLSDQIAKKKVPSLVKYAEYLLKLHNASLKTSTIVTDYDPRLIVGRTFFDEKNNKFGYIMGVSKTINTGGNVTVTLNLSYVRDAYIKNGELTFEHIETLTELAQQFQDEQLQTVSDPESKTK